jgi:hypothetical protein
MWRGAVASAIRGKRGQALLREMRDALDAMPDKRLIAHELIAEDGCVCGLGSVAKARGMDVSQIDESDRDEVAAHFGIAPALAAEVADVNDENFACYAYPELPDETVEQRRWRGVRQWVAEQLGEEPTR